MGTAWVALGSLIAAVFAYVFQIVGGRALGAEAFAPIGVLWTVQFLAMQVLYQPLEHLVNREASLGRAPALRHVWMLGGGAAVAAVGLLLTFGDGIAGTYVAAAAALVIAYALFGYARGRLAGEERFAAFGVLTAGEATVRLVVALALVWAVGAAGLVVAMVAAPLLAMAWLRPTDQPRTGGVIARDLRPLVAASAFAQGLLGLPPLVVAWLGASAATVSVVFMTFTIFRGPLWIIQGLMARALPVLVGAARDRDDVRIARVLSRLIAGSVAVAVLAAGAGALVAPDLFAWLLGADFRPDAGFAALVAAGVVLAAGGGFMNQVLLALGRLHAITAAWSAGFAVAVTTVALLPATASLRVAVAFLAGEVTAIVALTILSRRKARDVPDRLVVIDAQDTAAAR
jgi:O-antigen/teichoic acid export membrane protein